MDVDCTHDGSKQDVEEDTGRDDAVHVFLKFRCFCPLPPSPIIPSCARPHPLMLVDPVSSLLFFSRHIVMFLAEREQALFPPEKSYRA